MFIIKVALYFTLIALQNHCITGTVVSSPVAEVSSQHLKHRASNQQASTNEHFHSTSQYDESTQTEYVNDNEKYHELVDRLKIIPKIESPISTISVHDDGGTLIEKETVVTKQWPDYNSYVKGNSNPRELVTNYRAPSNDHDDQHKEFFSEFKADGNCNQKCQVEKASAVTSMLVTLNDDDDDDSLTSYRSPLKRTNHFSPSSRVLQNLQLHEIHNSLPAGVQIGRVSLTSLPQDRRLQTKSIYNEQYRDRRQLRFVPAPKLNNQGGNDRSLLPDNKQSIIDQSIRNLDPSIIHSLLGVFDKMHPIFNPSFRRIKPNQILIVPPRYIDDAKILPTPYNPTSPARVEDIQSSMKNTPRNPNGFGESERVLTTDITGNERQPQIIQQHFLPTVPPLTNPKITNSQTIHHSHDHQLPQIEEEEEEEEEYYPKNHQMPTVGKSMLSTSENLYRHEAHEKPQAAGGQRESYKHQSKDTKYERYAANYSFKYHVTDEESENDFGHYETRNEQITDGNYHVRLPDGRIQRVNYYVDGTGYHAKVSYEFDEKYYQKQAENDAK